MAKPEQTSDTVTSYDPERGRAWDRETQGTPVCHVCGKPVTCIGEYEICTGVERYACDACCGHGNEDGHCRPV